MDPPLHIKNLTPIVNLFPNEATHVTVDITSGDMCENLKSFHLPSQLHHPQSAFYIALDGLIESGVEINTGCTI